MTAYFKLNYGAWRRLRRTWNVPWSPALAWQTGLGAVRSATDMLQTAIVGRRRARQRLHGAIVILGFWRSGTTLLHELLCTDPQFGFPTTYACLNPHHFILTQKFALRRMKGRVRRLQDNMMIGPDTPQEEEFALLCMGARSPYETILMSGHFTDAFAISDTRDMSPPDANRWRRSFLKFIRGVSLLNEGKRLVLKSPAHSYRVSLLREILPDARFILITRDPFEVFESMVRAVKALTEKYGLYPMPSDDEIREHLLTERTRFERKLALDIEELPSNKLAIVKYERLVAEPEKVIADLYRQLDVPGFEEMKPFLEREIATRRDYIKEAQKPKPDWARRITEEWGAVFRRYGYSREGVLS